MVCYAKYRQSQNISTNYIIRILLHNQNISIKERDITYNLLKLHVVRTIIGPIYKYHCASDYHTHIISEHLSYLNHENENRRSTLTHLFKNLSKDLNIFLIFFIFLIKISFDLLSFKRFILVFIFY